MKNTISISILIAAGVLLLAGVGCAATQTLAEGVAEKSLSGSGTVAIQRVGIDDETKTPVLKSTVITGDYASARNGDYALQYRRRKSPSIFNSTSITEEVTINYIGTREYARAALEAVRKDLESGKESASGTPVVEVPGVPAATDISQ